MEEERRQAQLDTEAKEQQRKIEAEVLEMSQRREAKARAEAKEKARKKIE